MAGSVRGGFGVSVGSILAHFGGQIGVSVYKNRVGAPLRVPSPFPTFWAIEAAIFGHFAVSLLWWNPDLGVEMVEKPGFRVSGKGVKKGHFLGINTPLGGRRVVGTPQFFFQPFRLHERANFSRSCGG